MSLQVNGLRLLPSMKHLSSCLILVLLLVSGCDTVRYFTADRTDKEQREQLEKDRVEYEFKSAEARYLSGEIDADTYYRILKHYSLPPTD